MKEKRLEIRIENKKKNELKQMASQMNISLSTLLSIMIDQYLTGNDNLNIYSRNAVSKHFMNIYNLMGNVEGEVRILLLKELGELECLL